MQNEGLSTRHVIIIGITCIVGIILFGAVIQWLGRYLTTGTLSVTTDSQYSTITVSSVSNNPSTKTTTITGKGSLKAKLHSGKYYVSVQSGTTATNQYANVASLKTTALNIKPILATGVEPVVYGDLQNVVASNAQLSYLDLSSGINYITAGNSILNVPGTNGFISAAWSDPSYGVGLDPTLGLYTISNGDIQYLNSPVQAGQASGISYGISSNHTIYITYNSAVYRGTDTSGFKKIYSNQPSDAVVSVGNKEVSLVTTGYSGNDSPQVTVIADNGKVTTKTFKSPITGWSPWSPGDKYMAIVSGITGNIYDTSLHQVATIPQTSVSYASWLDNNTLIYSVGGQLWSYDVSQQRSQLIATMPLNEQIQSVSVSLDKAYVYVTTVSSSTNQVDAIRRVGLKGQSVPSGIYELQNVLPQDENNYTMSLVNFSGTPSIIVVTPAANEAQNIQSAQSTLQSLVNISGYQFVAQIPSEG